ncbi:DUF6580 family putative transport protein [Owenweeksia hongkongensis]|uniref:DUF6580 family putative transport protein n=1 Tax=Owenweeksia hongkongensis TaxID=253245 RepID=UPI003A90A0CA
MQQQNRIIVLITLIVAAIATRFLPHAPNFTAVGATALFGGVLFRNNLRAFMIPAIALFASDLVLNNLVYGQYYEGFQWLTPGFAFIYGAFFITVLMGRYFTSGFKALPLIGAGLASAIVFYLLTNFGAWLGSPMYPQTFGGLIQSYVAGLPFLLNQVAGTAFYGVIMFSAAYFLTGAHKPSTVNA